MQMEGHSKKVIVAGHICLDVAPVFDVANGSISELLVPGRLLPMDGIDIHTGGCVANTGLAMKLLGADVTLLGKIGRDEFGSLVLQILQKYGYDGVGDMIMSEEDSTSYSVVLNVPGNDRIFLHDPAANNTFCSDDVDFTGREDTALFHFGYPPLMARMCEKDGEELVNLFRRASQLGIATSLDLAAVDGNGPAGQADWKRILERVVPYVDFFLPSAEELCYMLDRERFDEWRKRAGGDDITKRLDIMRDVKPLADQMMQMGAKVILIKCGVAGLYYQTSGAEVLTGIGKNAGINIPDWCGKEGLEECYTPDCVRSSTGAGDTCIAAFLTAMLKQKGLQRCIQLAAAAGACCVTSYDALGGLIPLEAMEEKIDAGWEKMNEQ